MNNTFRPLCLIGALLVSLVFTPSAQADLAGAFTIPPFQLEKSIIGIEGWKLRLPGVEDDGLSARMVAVRWDDGKPALLIDGANIQRSFAPPKGSKVKVTIILALTFPPSPKLQPLRISLGGAPFKEFVFHGEAGLGFSDGTGVNVKTLIPIDQIKPNSYYTISIVSDYETATYDIEITGQNRDGTPLNYQKKGEAFEAKKFTMESVFIIASQAVRAYLKELSFQSL